MKVNAQAAIVQENKFATKGKSKVIEGSILTPHNAGLRFILSVNNLDGKIESNPILPILDKKWKKVREETKGWFANKTGEYKLGAITTTPVQSDTWVINMLCQKSKADDFEMDEAGLRGCLKKVQASAKYESATVHVSTTLTDSFEGLAELITEELVNKGTTVYFYNEPKVSR